MAERFAPWPGGSINAGGDLRVWGEPPDGERWVVGIEAPFDADRERCLISILDGRAGAIATSAMNRHAWRIGDERYHHLIDPATGRPILGRSSPPRRLDPISNRRGRDQGVTGQRRPRYPLEPADASGAVVIDVTGTLLAVPGRFPMRLRSTRSIPLAAPPEPAGVYPVGLLVGFSH